jgi:Transposase domain (DUF772)
VRADRAVPSLAGQWPAAGRGRADAAPLFLAGLVQPVGPGGGGGALRFAANTRFVGIDLGREPVPDETTVCRFRHLLEAHDLGRRLFDEVHRHLAAKGLKVASAQSSLRRLSMHRLRPFVTVALEYGTVLSIMKV